MEKTMKKRKTNAKAKKPHEQNAIESAKLPAQKVVSKETGDKKKLYAKTKQELLVEMLSKKSGANIDAIVKATGWLPHTSRAMISNLRKSGHKVETEPVKDGKAVYRIVGSKKSSGKASR
jgi:hypothetical protein